MSKKMFFSISVTLCLFATIIVTCFAWFRDMSNVNARLDNLTAQTPTRVVVNINGTAVNGPINLNGEGDLIPCLPQSADVAGLKADAEWLVPSFLPAKRSRRCSYDFNFSFSGLSGVNPVILDSIVITPYDSLNASDIALSKNVRYAVFLSETNNVEADLIAYSAYYFGIDGAIKEAYNHGIFNYNFSARQNIRVIIWADGYSCNHDEVLGGRINIEIDFNVGES